MHASFVRNWLLSRLQRSRLAGFAVSAAGWFGGALVIAAADMPRRTIFLDGIWQVAEGALGHAPAHFDRTVPVPGLVSLAQPAFLDPGAGVQDRKELPQKDPRRDAF